MHRLHLGHVLGASAFLAIPVAVFVSKALAPLFVATAVFALAVYWWKERQPPDLPKFFPAFFVALTLFGLASAVWSAAPLESLRLVAPLAATFSCGLVLMFLAFRMDEGERRFFENALIAGVFLGFAILAFEMFSSITLTRALWLIFREVEVAKVDEPFTYLYANYYKPGLTFASFMIWPALAALWRRDARILACLLYVLALAVIIKGGSNTAAVSVIAGSLASVTAFFLRERAWKLFAAMIVAGAAFLPLAIGLTPDIGKFNLAGKELPDSFYTRIFIWKSAAKFIGEAPFLGKGLNASRTFSSKKDKVHYHTLKNKHRMWSEPIPLHPHNVILQAWLELGLAGALMLMALLLALIRRIESGQDLAGRALSYGAFFSVLTAANVSFGMWQSWWQGTLWLLAAYTAAGQGKR